MNLPDPPPLPSGKDKLTISEIATLYSVPVRVVKRWIDAKRLPVVREFGPTSALRRDVSPLVDDYNRIHRR
jgi:hypothetical protein